MKIFDVFPYNGEPIVSLRLQLLSPVVDKFIITEAKQTFSGLNKPSLFKDCFNTLFEPYQCKIQWLIIEGFKQTSPWHREAFQRNYPIDVLLQEDEHIALICDADEIPDPAIVEKLRSGEISNFYNQQINLDLNLFYYNFNWIKPFNIKDSKSYAIKSHYNKIPTLDQRRLKNNGPTRIKNAGWHGAYFFDAEGIINKIKSYSHTENNLPQFTSLNNIATSLATGKDLFNRNKKHCSHFDTSSLPPLLRSFNQHLVSMQYLDLAL